MTKVFWGILLLGFALRLFFAFSGNPADVRGGGDEFWYLANGLGMYQPEPEGVVYGNFPYAVNALASAPLYLLIVGVFQLVFSLETSVRIIWVLQAIAGTISAYLAYRIAWKMSDDERVGYVAGIVLALSPVMLREPSSILTESFYILFLLLGFWLYLEAVDKGKIWYFVLAGIVFGLATLTRATSLLFPLGLATQLLLIHLKDWKRGLYFAFVLIISYSLMAGTWTAFNWLKYQRLVIGSEQLTGAFWRGAVETDGSPRENDAQLGEQSYEEQAAEVIASDPNAYIKRRFAELLEAYLQPHGTLGLGGDSLKVMAEDWIRSGFSIEGFFSLINGEGFWPKLIIYLFHYIGLFGGILGMLLSWKQWRFSLALIGFIGYTTVLHFVLLALPRYIFPTYPIFWIFAAFFLVWLWDKLKGHTRKYAPKTD